MNPEKIDPVEELRSKAVIIVINNSLLGKLSASE